jgi:hypothetical protein
MGASMSYKPMPCVARFIEEFKDLTPEQRKKAVGEMAGFCVGYRDGADMSNLIPIDFIDEPEFNDSEGEPCAALTETVGSILAETMTTLHVKPHRGKRGGKAPAPKGWS